MEPIQPASVAHKQPGVDWSQPRTNNSSVSKNPINYPATSKKPVSQTLHGVTITDDYKWLEKESPDVNNWKDLQAKVTDHYFKDISIMPIAHSILPLMLCDTKIPSKPVLVGNRRFEVKYKKMQGSGKISLHEGTKKTTLINPNKWNTTLSCNEFKPSYNGNFLTLNISENFDHRTLIRIFDVTKKMFTNDRLSGMRQRDASWSPLGDEFIYSASETKEGHNDIYLHKVGGETRLLFKGSEEAHWTWGKYSIDGKYMIFSRTRGDQKNELYFKSVTDEKIRSIIKGYDHRNNAFILNDLIYIKSDLRANMSEVYVTSIKHPHSKHWRPLIKEDPQFKIESIQPINGHLYVTGIRNASNEIKIYDLNGIHLKSIPLPCHGTVSVAGEWNSAEIRVEFQSFLYPRTYFRYDFETNTLTLIHQDERPFDPAKYAMEQVFATSPDGTQISMFLLRQKETKANGKNPTVIAGYGGFDISATPCFISSVLPWIDAGGIVAMPNIRGGGEYGEKWHEGGKGKNKQNCFDDFFASIDYLIQNKWTSPEYLAAFGGSNGGLLMAALATQRPELVKAIVCMVPLCDMVGMESDQMGNVWSKEYGSVKDAEMFPILHNYSPYHHVQDGVKYPSMLITTAEHDSLVAPGHGKKMVARLQAANPKGNPIIYMNMGGGHNQSDGGINVIIDSLRLLAFLAKELDVKLPEKSFFSKMGNYADLGGIVFDSLIGKSVARKFSRTPEPK